MTVVTTSGLSGGGQSRDGEIMLSPFPLVPSTPSPSAPAWIKRSSLAAAEVRVIAPVDGDMVVLLLAGAASIEDGRCSWIAPAGHAMTFPAGSLPRVTAIRACTLGITAIDGLAQAEPRLFRISPLLMAIALHDAADVESPHARALFLHEMRSAERAPHSIRLPNDPRARAIAQAIVRDPADERSLAIFADQSGASRRTLLRLFVAETGLSFRQFRRHVRIHNALAMLTDGMAMQDVALAVGYESLPAFIAAFRAVIGDTPGRHLRAAGSATLT